MPKSKNNFASLNKKDKVDFYISLIVILFAGILIFSFTFPSTNNLEIHNENSLLTENTMNISALTIQNKTYKPLEKSFESRTLIEAPSEIKNVKVKSIISNSKDVFIGKDVMNEEEEVSDIMNGIENVEDVEDDIQGSEEQIEEAEKSDANGTKLEDTNPIELEDKAEAEVEENTNLTNETDASESCLIIIGAFKKEKNKAKLLDGLKSDGYRIFTTPYKGATRIGIYQQCNSETITTTLRLVRKKYAKDAMILVEE